MEWWIGLAIAAGAIGFGLHRMALWADRRGWLYYKTKPKFRGSSLGLIEGIYNPSAEHVVEEKTSERARGSEDQSGDKPDPGSDRTPD